MEHLLPRHPTKTTASPCDLPSHSHSGEHRGVESVTGLIWPARREAGGIELRKKPVKRGAASVADSQEDSGSGDPHVRMPAGQITDTSSAGKQWTEEEFLDRATASPSRTTAPWSKGLPRPSTDKALSPDSAEIDHLLQVSRETSLQPPSGPEPERSNKEESAEAGKPDGLLEGASSRSAGRGAQGSSDIAMGTPGGPLSASLPPINPAKPSDPPFHQPVTDLIDIDYYDSLDAHGPLGHFPGGDATKRFHGRHPPREPDLYEEEISPFDDSYFYPTTSFYADGDDDVENEDDDDEEPDDLKDDGVSVREPETGRAAKDATQAPKVKTAMVEERPTSRQHVPHQTFILYGGELHPKIHPDIHKDSTQTSPGAGDNSTECRNGYVKRNNSCKSLCDIYPAYCHNGGQCYIVETMGAFCRCNTQDYIWHKGLRCESIITDFQVMCVAVGTAALVVLLLFMMTVFFAKKLYLLKTENYKLRKRNRYRTPSELHNDNFSLSTIAEGSHPNVRKLCDAPSVPSPHARAMAYYDNVICQEDPNAPQKVQDLPKACLKDEEPFNIQNSLSPKHESGKGDPDIADVNCVLNNLT
ncbi:chondroitin sulfate proteoglycan 5 [Spea bombifrons]|uniref:chondroitin sulfate proteoglycan 5 n=1 Tax=Spea bombifrons TaxID=233779 RepID=UPI00234A288E|nr:chondroitin sulfate proteoglycan 5 [Spea bombifrons]